MLSFPVEVSLHFRRSPPLASSRAMRVGIILFARYQCTGTVVYILDTERGVLLNLLARFGFLYLLSISLWHLYTWFLASTHVWVSATALKLLKGSNSEKLA